MQIQRANFDLTSTSTLQLFSVSGRLHCESILNFQENTKRTLSKQ